MVIAFSKQVAGKPRDEPIAPADPVLEIKPVKRRPNGNPKRLISLRLDPEAIDWFKERGDGWQARINAALWEHINNQSKAKK